MVRLSLVEGSDWAQSLAKEWEGLFQQAEFATPFQTLEWLSNWMSSFGKSRLPMILTARLGHDLVGAYPLMRVGGAWQSLRPMGAGHSDYLHPLIRKDTPEVADMMAAWLSDQRNFNLLDLHQLRKSTSLAAAFASRAGNGSITVVEQALCPVLTLPATFEEYLKVLSKSLRYDVRRSERPPFSTGNAQICTASSEDEALRYLDAFFMLHAGRWRRRGLPGAFAGTRVKEFHRRFALQALRNDRLRLSVLLHDDVPIGAVYVMTCGDASYFYQSGFDPIHKSLSPGTVLVAHAIRRSIEDGAFTFDFLRGDETYKIRWKPQRKEPNLRIIKSLNGWIGNAATAWNQIGGKVEMRLRARLEGRGLL